MEKPKDYNYYNNRNNKIPRSQWPQECKDYDYYLSLVRKHPEWKGLSFEKVLKENDKYKEELKKKNIQRLQEYHKNASKEEKQRMLEKRKNYYDSLPKEKLEEINKKKGSHYNNLSDEEKKKQNEELRKRSQSFWDGMTDEERKEFGQYRWNLKTEEEKEKVIRQFREGNKAYCESLTQEEINEQMNYIRNIHLEKLQTDEEYRNHCFSELNKNMHNYWDNITEEQRKEISDRQKEYWKNLTNEEKNFIINNLTNSYMDWYNDPNNNASEILSTRIKEYWKNLTKEEYHDLCIKIRDGRNNASHNKTNMVFNKNEYEFINMMNIWKIKYEVQYCNSTKHEKFDELFPINPITNSKFINPYHQWDFKIITKSKEILVDVDGSIHDPSKIDNQYIKFNDSQRPYQTDGLEAYIIKCYKDDLYDKDVIVENIKTKECMNLKQFIALIDGYNLF